MRQPSPSHPPTHPPMNTQSLFARRLGELNASCVGFTTHLELAETVADAIIAVVTARKAAAVA